MLKKLFIGAIRFYQKSISPYIDKNCIYTPSCSEYTIQAINEFGVIKGTYYGIKRILRCHPFAKGGYDPIPKK